MSSFSVLVLAMLVAIVTSKQGCPVCHEIRNSLHGDGSCAAAVRSTDHDPCPEGQVCKAIVLEGGYGGSFTMEIHVNCFAPVPTCDTLSQFATLPQVEIVRRCTENTLFPPDKCPNCILTEASINGNSFHAENNCNTNPRRWATCDPGYSCNFLEIKASFQEQNVYVYTYVVGCGLTYDYCQETQRNMENTDYCAVKAFPSEYEGQWY